MDDVIKRTKELIQVLEGSDLIRNLERYKARIMVKKNLLELIYKYNNSFDDYEKLSLKKEIFKDSDYTEYVKYYNELFYYVLKINQKFKSYTKEGSC